MKKYLKFKIKCKIFYLRCLLVKYVEILLKNNNYIIIKKLRHIQLK